ncbi:hypothetical protein [Streptosporangium sp. NPDC020145]|uniref:hypothetical protein n=1 Tax=unclassified Streptosporangium TaxID=2632669 RepID=UPI003447E5F6
MSYSGRAPYAWPYALASVVVAAGVAGISVAIVTGSPEPPVPGPDPGLTRVVTRTPVAAPYPPPLPPGPAAVLVPPVARKTGHRAERLPAHLPARPHLRPPAHPQGRTVWGRTHPAPRQLPRHPKVKKPIRRPEAPARKPRRQSFCDMLDGIRRAYCDAVLDGLEGR